ncbi:unnamed protein product (mitochondrion) [Plasmodiophora brassicae]|uniref:Uncharacterized protein n=1 Tax=Plasmodiophora brassicae TaxID=37360 RepID=A0A3P3YMT7_PLABS|nr:unnamed protein product [Plasmodiophora brassicae]
MSKTKLVWLKTRPEKEKFRHSKVCRVWYQPDQTVPPSSPIPSRRDEGADLLLPTIVPKGPRSPPAEKVMSPVEALDDPPPVHHDALSRHSLPWGFRYGAFDAVNTCAVDTGLMTVFILHKYLGLHIPASHPQLLEAVTLIGQGSHEEARFLWATRGPKPLCQTCGNAIERDQRRLVIVTRNELRQWNKQLSYHLADECLTTGLTAAQKVELTTLLEADDILRTQLAGTGHEERDRRETRTPCPPFDPASAPLMANKKQRVERT